MKKTASALIGISVLLVSTLFGVQPVSFANALTYTNPTTYSASIQSPENGAYFSSSFTSTFNLWFDGITPNVQVSVQNVICKYSLDDGEWKDAQFQKTITSRVFKGWIVGCEYSTVLHGLSQGLHSIKVMSNPVSQVYFVWGSTGIPVLSPQNKTYDTHDIQLNFRANFPARWAYSLDNQANVTINGNITLSGLSDGLHSIIVYNNDVAGDIGTSSRVQFTVNTTKPSPSPSPSPYQPTSFLGTNLPIEYGYAIVAVLASMVVVGAGLAFYFKKRKH